MSQLPDLSLDTFARRLRTLAPALAPAFPSAFPSAKSPIGEASRPARSATASGGAEEGVLGPEFGQRVLERLLDDRALERLHAHYGELRRWSPRLSLVGPGTTDDAVERHYGEALAALPLVPARLLGPVVTSGPSAPGVSAFEVDAPEMATSEMVSPEVAGASGREGGAPEVAGTSGDGTSEDAAAEDDANAGPRPAAAVGTLVDVGSGAGFPGFVLAALLPWLDAWLVEPRQRRWAFLLAAARRASLPCRCLDARVEDPLSAEFPAVLDLVTIRALKLPPEALDALARRLSPDGRVLLWAGDSLPTLPPGLRREAEVEVPGSDRRRVVALAPA